VLCRSSAGWPHRELSLVSLRRALSFFRGDVNSGSLTAAAPSVLSLCIFIHRTTCRLFGVPTQRTAYRYLVPSRK
jgi:hypothetical protein